MADLLWQKPGVAVDARIQAFLAGDDVLLDREFFLHDITASTAHAEGLQRIGILGADELDGLKRELLVLAEDFRSGAFAFIAVPRICCDSCGICGQGGCIRCGGRGGFSRDICLFFRRFQFVLKCQYI